MFAHISSLDELEAVLAGGAAGILHSVADYPLPDRGHASAMGAVGFTMVPTLVLRIEPERLDDPFLRATLSEEEVAALTRPDFVERVRSRWERSSASNQLASIPMLHEQGVRVVLGTDTGVPYVFSGYSVHNELDLLVRAGLTPMEAIEAATRRVAEMIGVEDEFGTIEPGKRADLLILGANPLDEHS